MAGKTSSLRSPAPSTTFSLLCHCAFKTENRKEGCIRCVWRTETFLRLAGKEDTKEQN